MSINGNEIMKKCKTKYQQAEGQQVCLQQELNRLESRLQVLNAKEAQQPIDLLKDPKSVGPLGRLYYTDRNKKCFTDEEKIEQTQLRKVIVEINNELTQLKPGSQKENSCTANLGKKFRWLADNKYLVVLFELLHQGKFIDKDSKSPALIAKHFMNADKDRINDSILRVTRGRLFKSEGGKTKTVHPKSLEVLEELVQKFNDAIDEMENHRNRS